MDVPTSTWVARLRPATDADRDFLRAVYAATREDELAQVAWAPGQREWFVRMQFDAQDADYRRRNPHGTFDVVEVDGRPAGRLYVDRRQAEIRVVDIALLPEFRGGGVGSGLLRDLQREAADTGRALTIHVEVHNRARLLYERLGFRVVSTADVHQLMEWTP